MSRRSTIDAIATMALTVVLVLVLPARDWSLGGRIGALSLIVVGVPTLVCGLRHFIRPAPHEPIDNSKLAPGARPR